MFEADNEWKCRHNSKPVCPHCGHAMEDAWELGMERDDECHEVECGECLKAYAITVTHTTTYSTAPVGGWPNG